MKKNKVTYEINIYEFDIDEKTKNELKNILYNPDLSEAETLKLLRLTAGITQIELADTFHISQTLVSQWEKGTRTPSFEHLYYLGILYRFHPDEMLEHFGYTITHNY